MSEIRLGHLNKVFLMGRMTRDPEIKYTTTGSQVCSFSIAVSKRYRDKQGNWQEDTSFVDIVLWGQQAENISQRGKKGYAVLVEGKLKSSRWEDQSGAKRSKLEVYAEYVQILEKTSTGSDAEPHEESNADSSPPYSNQADDDELPF
jgi:single-strand DNA-binding protein